MSSLGAMRRWNFDADGEHLYVCKGDHDKPSGCALERLHPAEALTIINQLRAEAMELEAKLAAVMPDLFAAISALDPSGTKVAVLQTERHLNKLQVDSLVETLVKMFGPKPRVAVIQGGLRLITDSEGLSVMAQDLVDTAAAAGLVLTIEQFPLQPLAMGNYSTRVSVRPARQRAEAGA